ncbi:MAG: hypothetical protein LIP02_00360 [Bacteroidales bacterium]|nr:hypothetical protein [Bacteroidales bacterium]
MLNDKWNGQGYSFALGVFLTQSSAVFRSQLRAVEFSHADFRRLSQTFADGFALMEFITQRSAEDRSSLERLRSTAKDRVPKSTISVPKTPTIAKLAP